MKGGIWIVIFPAAVSLSACAGPPAYNLPGQPTVAQIIDRVQCEVADAKSAHPRLAKERWIAVANLFLQVDDRGSLTPSVEWMQAFFRSGTSLAVGASIDFQKERQRIYNETFKISIADMKPKSCPEKLPGVDLTGDLGILETVNMGLGSVDKADSAKLDEKEAFGQTIQFVLAFNVSAAGPTWTLQHFVGPGGLIGAERKDTHKLIISFAPGEETKSGSAKGVGVARRPAADRARELNNNMLLQSLPALRQ